MRPPPFHVQLHNNGDYWQARWYDADGQRHTESLGSKKNLTNIAAAQECRALERRIRMEASGGVPTIATVAARTIGKRKELKPKTRAGYTRALGLFAEWAGEALRGDRTRLDEVTRADATDFRDWLLTADEDEDPAVLTTVNKHLRAIRAVYFMVADEIEGFPNPFSRRRWPAPRVAQDWPEFSHDDLRALLAVCPNSGWRALLALCRWAGLRRGEALRLRRMDYDGRRQMLTILPEPDASGARIEGTKQRARTVPVRPELAALLDPIVKYLQPGELVCAGVDAGNIERTLCGGKVGGRAPEKRRCRRYIGLLEKAGLPVYRKVPQTMRRNCGTEWAEHGIPITDVAKWMGNSVAVAEVYYVRTTPGTFARVTGPGTNAGTNGPEHPARAAASA